MFDFAGRRKILEAIEILSTNLAVTEGQVAGLHAVVTSIIATMKESERQTMVELLKLAVGPGLGGNSTWLNEREKQAYNDAMSITVQTSLKTSLPKASVLKAHKRASGDHVEVASSNSIKPANVAANVGVRKRPSGSSRKSARNSKPTRRPLE
jgi:hypothetical protein